MNELMIRLEEQIRIYKDSPSTTATYSDIARIIEDIITIIRKKEILGFNMVSCSKEDK